MELSKVAAPGPVATPARPVRKDGPGVVTSLELLRGLASLDVFLWHMLNADSGVIFIPGFYRLVGWSRESVIIFFVLSGYVISLSQQRRHRPAGEFLKARVKRIVPIYLVALAASLIVGHLVDRPSSDWQIIGHLLFLQSYEGSLVPQLPTNAPLWSLGIEFQFYVVMTLILLLRVRALMFVWAGLSLAAGIVRYAGYGGSGFTGFVLEVLGLSPCWLIGFGFATFGARYSLTLVQAIGLFLLVPLISGSDYGAAELSPGSFDNLKCLLLALAIVPLIHTLAVRQLYPKAEPSPHGWAIVGVAYVVIATWALLSPLHHFTPIPVIVLAALPPLFCAYGSACLPQKASWPVTTPWFRRICLVLGGASYAIYAIHTPIMFLGIHYVNANLRCLFILVVLVAAVALLEYVFQPFAAACIDRVWKSSRRED